jgi:hypothetical protein
VLLEPESDVVAGWLASARDQKAGEVQRVFRRELGALEPGERAVLAAALATGASWNAWQSYRVHRRLGVERSRAAMRRTLGALLGER